MSRPSTERADPDLEAALSGVEARLSAMAEAAQRHDAAAIEAEAAALHKALAVAVRHFAQAAQGTGVPPPLRRRLAAVGAQVAAQREVMARTTASLDRAIDVLVHGVGVRRHTQPLYNAAGGADRNGPGGSALA